MRAELLAARAKLAACGVPAGDIVGLRSPQLEGSPVIRQVLAANGFLYDSSIVERVGGGGPAGEPSLSQGMARRTWPYTLHAGVPQNCSAAGPAQRCNPVERHPGLWELPGQR